MTEFCSIAWIHVKALNYHLGSNFRKKKLIDLGPFLYRNGPMYHRVTSFKLCSVFSASSTNHEWFIYWRLNSPHKVIRTGFSLSILLWMKFPFKNYLLPIWCLVDILLKYLLLKYVPLWRKFSQRGIKPSTCVYKTAF